MTRLWYLFLGLLLSLPVGALALQGIDLSSTNTGIIGNAATTFTPSLTCGTATFTVNSARQKVIYAKLQWFSLDFTITAIGSCGTALTFTAPATAQNGSGADGRETASITGAAIQCSIAAAGATATCTTGASVNYLVNERFMLSGTYETP